MIIKRPAEDRGHLDHGWLDARHTFSFGHFFDPDYMGFRSLRVLNEDRVLPENGFATHGHNDMEIISYVLGGELTHRDSMGNESVLRPGDVQHMTAGSGVRHSEMNASKDESVHFIQIWILPEAKGLKPHFEERSFPVEERTNTLRRIVSKSEAEGALPVHQDVELFATLLDTDKALEHPLAPGRHAWVQVAKGALEVNGELLQAGDAAALSGESAVRLVGRSNGSGPAEALVFDLA